MAAKKRSQPPKTLRKRAPPGPEPTTVDFEALRKDAGALAEECGLKRPFVVGAVERVDFPGHGHGYSVHVRESEGFERLGMARYAADGSRTMWTIEGCMGF